MSLRFKILISLCLQLLLFVVVPPLLSRAGLRAANWVRVWEYVSDHEFFSTASRNRVVLLGDSSMGGRYCNKSPEVPGAAVDDDCALRAAMDFQKSEFPGLSRFEFFDFTKNGTYAEAHLYYFLLMLSHGGENIRYLIYSLPGKLTLDLHQRSYYVLGEQTTRLIRLLPPELHSEKLDWLAAHNEEKLREFAKEEKHFHLRDRLRRFKEIFWAHRSFVQDLLGDLRERYAPNASEAIFKTYLKRQADAGELVPEDHFARPAEPPDPSQYFERESDFLFLDILSDLCKKMGIQLIFYIPPNRVTCPRENPEPCESKIYRPIVKRYESRGVAIIDKRRDDFLVPRDSLDGIHPGLFYKLSLAKEFLNVIRSFEEKKAR